METSKQGSDGGEGPREREGNETPSKFHSASGKSKEKDESLIWIDRKRSEERTQSKGYSWRRRRRM